MNRPNEDQEAVDLQPVVIKIKTTGPREGAPTQDGAVTIPTTIPGWMNMGIRMKDNSRVTMEGTDVRGATDAFADKEAEAEARTHHAEIKGDTHIARVKLGTWILSPRVITMRMNPGGDGEKHLQTG